MHRHRAILITAATETELAGLRGHFGTVDAQHLSITFRCTGVGMVNTAMHLTETLAGRPFDLALNIGIAGSYDPAIRIGDVVQVGSDRIGWLGAEDRAGFLPAEDLGLCPADEVAFRASFNVPGLPVARGITVNMAHGSAAGIRRAGRLFDPQVETMEGAAFFRVCHHFGIPALQLRAISNRVEPRDREAWDIPLALNNLTAAVIDVLNGL